MYWGALGRKRKNKIFKKKKRNESDVSHRQDADDNMEGSTGAPTKHQYYISEDAYNFQINSNVWVMVSICDG